MSMNDERGCSVCQPGKENYEHFTTRLRGKSVRRTQYDYRTPDGNYSLVSAQTLTTAGKSAMSGYAAGKERMVRDNLPSFVSSYYASNMTTI